MVSLSHIVGAAYLLGAICWIANASWAGWPSESGAIDALVLGVTAVAGAVLFHVGAMAQLWDALNNSNSVTSKFSRLPTSAPAEPWLDPSFHSNAASSSSSISRSSSRQHSELVVAGCSPTHSTRSEVELGEADSWAAGAPRSCTATPSPQQCACCHEPANCTCIHQQQPEEQVWSSGTHRQHRVSAPAQFTCSVVPQALGAVSEAATSADTVAKAHSQPSPTPRCHSSSSSCPGNSLHQQQQDCRPQSTSLPWVGWQQPDADSPPLNLPAQHRDDSRQQLKQQEEQECGWVWWEWRPNDICFMAAFVQVIGTSIFAAACICGFPGVLPTDYAAGDWRYWDAFFWAPFLIGSCLFITSAALSLRDCQGSWWLPANPKTCLTNRLWWMHVLNVIGSIGFWLCSFFGFFAHPAEKYQRWGMAFSCLWGSCCFALAGFLQLLLACQPVRLQ